jgi:flagellar motor switch protein FliN
MSDENETVEPEKLTGADVGAIEDAPSDAEQAAADLLGASAKGEGRNIDAMLNVDLQVQIVLGRSRMPISQLLKLTRGSIIELDKKIGDPVEVMVNNRLVARGDLVKLADDRLGVSLTEIVKDYVGAG